MNLYTSKNQPAPEDKRTSSTSIRYQRQLKVLSWKCYLQRQRRWPILLAETAFAFFLFLIAIYVAKPVFLTLLTPNQAPPLEEPDILATFDRSTIVGFAPNEPHILQIMDIVSKALNIDVVGAESKNHLHMALYSYYNGTKVNRPVTWILFMEKIRNMWSFKIRSTERAKYAGRSFMPQMNPHLRSGFLAVQIAVCRAIIEVEVNSAELDYKLSLKPIPVSPLMKEEAVRNVISVLLVCFTIAFLPPVMETQALVVQESLTGFKRALRIYTVSYSVMYLAWLSFAFFTALPILLLASITLILIFRWIHIFYALVLVLAYYFVMIMVALIMALYHRKVWIAASWTMLFTVLQTLLAELLVYHRYDQIHNILNLIVNTILPPMGLIQGLNQFALLETGRSHDSHSESSLQDKNFLQMVGMWVFMIIVYFGVLMLLQRTQNSAIGGAVSWKSIIFKHPVDENKLRYAYSSMRQNNVQAVDELVAKAISFKNVSKKILGEQILKNVTLDIYRGEFTMLFSERIQMNIIKTCEDLLIGLAQPDEGSITVLGEQSFKTHLMTTLYTMGYLHRHTFLIDDLTVEEHLTLFFEVRLWYEMSQDLFEYSYQRKLQLLSECELDAQKRTRVGDLSVYYRTQLCWALALLLEPRIVLISVFKHEAASSAVIVDKVVRYKKHLSILEMTTNSMFLEYADRVFLFDRRVLIFGGTPEYMFFKFGRDYRIRIIFRTNANDDDRKVNISTWAERYGARIREQFGHLLILRLPTSEPHKIAAFIQDLKENTTQYNILSYNISVPDTDEVYKRALFESRVTIRYLEDPRLTSLAPLRNINALPEWKRRSGFGVQLACIGRKFKAYYRHNPVIILVTFASALITGICIGHLLAKALVDMETDPFKQILAGEVLTVEAREKDTSTILSMRVDTNSSICMSVANAYVLSETTRAKSAVNQLSYTCLSHQANLMEYLVTQAVDSPQDYVFKYAYGLEITMINESILSVAALYSPLHADRSAAARSLTRAFMAILRHYSGKLDSSIVVVDRPLAADLSSILRSISPPPLMTQLLLIFTIAHVTLIPSKEHGLIRHTQANATSFSPLRYWLSLFIFDFCFYMILVTLMSTLATLVIYFVAPWQYVNHLDLLIIPFLLTIYGIACIPQAYIFSLLSSKHTLNAMIYVICTVVFGETTVLFKYLYGNIQNSIPVLILISPQFNMAVALLKIQLLFFHNSECQIYKARNLCHARSLHKCCEKCGVLQECFQRRSYFTDTVHGISKEIIGICANSIIFSVLLLLFQYRVFQILSKLFIQNKNKHISELKMPGIVRERLLVAEKKKMLLKKKGGELENFGSYLLASRVTKRESDLYVVHDVCLDVGKGEALALSGLLHHGRRELCEILAGCTLPSSGDVWAMSKWRLMRTPYRYSRQISFSCEEDPLPTWMTVFEGLRMIGLLRGIPKKRVKAEVDTYIEAMSLMEVRNAKICQLPNYVQRRLQVATAFIGAPPILVLDECTAFQNFAVRRAIYYILHYLKNRGHSILMSASDVETHLPVTNRLAIMLDGSIYDFGFLDEILSRYSQRGFTVVVHLKDEVDVNALFAKYFREFVVNDTTDVLVNVQILDANLDWSKVFAQMELLRNENYQVYSYIVCMVPIVHVCNNISQKETGCVLAQRNKIREAVRKIKRKPRIDPPPELLEELMPYEHKYHITNLLNLPWSVIFNR